MVATVYNNKFEHLYGCRKIVDDIHGKNGLTLLYEVPTAL